MSQLSFSVLTTNGRRHVVKVGRTDLLQQVLDQACQKQGLDPTRYGLKSGRKTLDLTQPVRFSQLPNNAKLELVPVAPAQASGAPKPAVIVLQTESGERLKHEFDPSATLWDVLLYWDGQPDRQESFTARVSPAKSVAGGCATKRLKEEHETYCQPVCQYMQRQFVSNQELQETTLHSLGLAGGRAAIRVSFRRVEPHEQMASATADSQQQEDGLEAQAQGADRMDTADDVVASTHPTVQESGSEQLEKQPQSQPVAAAPEPAPEQDPAPAPAVQPQPEAVAPAQPQQSQSPSQPAAAQPQQPRQTQPQQQHPSSARPPRAQQEQSAAAQAAAARASGQKPRRQAAAAAATPEQSGLTPEVLEALTNSEIRSKLLRHQAEQQTPTLPDEPCDRQAIALVLEDGKLTQEAAAEAHSDDFYQVTVSDLRQTLDSVQAARKEGDLMTRAMREKKELAGLVKYDKTLLRFYFPNRQVLQGYFYTMETVGDAYKFVQEHLKDPSPDFFLYTAPPRVVLEDKAATLLKARLVPSAIVRVGGLDAATEQFFNDSLASHQTSLTRQKSRDESSAAASAASANPRSASQAAAAAAAARAAKADSASGSKQPGKRSKLESTLMKHMMKK